MNSPNLTKILDFSSCSIYIFCVPPGVRFRYICPSFLGIEFLCKKAFFFLSIFLSALCLRSQKIALHEKPLSLISSKNSFTFSSQAQDVVFQSHFFTCVASRSTTPRRSSRFFFLPSSSPALGIYRIVSNIKIEGAPGTK